MEFELQYELDEFKEIQDQYFDEDGKCYTGINISTNIMEKMLKLIDNLSERVNELEPVIKQQIKKSLPIHGVGTSFFTYNGWAKISCALKSVGFPATRPS